MGGGNIGTKARGEKNLTCSQEALSLVSGCYGMGMEDSVLWASKNRWCMLRNASNTSVGSSVIAW